MKKFALLGDPLGHSLSPALHKAIYRQLEIDDASYRPIALSEDKLGGFFSGFRVGGFDGVNVTIPHKAAVIPLLDEIDAKAKLINAVNCIDRTSNRLTGYNTDMLGFAHSLRNNGGEIEANEFAIVGAGGSAQAVGAVLAEGAASHVYIVNRTIERAEELKTTIKTLNPECKVTITDEAGLEQAQSKLHCLVNTTSVGMSPKTEVSPINDLDACITPQTLVFDLIYNPGQTKLLRDAEALGAPTLNGLEMLVAQAVYSVEIWLRGNVIAHIDMQGLVRELERILAKLG
ncbi:MAG: shikimate dehydrogenase [Pseudomonadota bacterium]